MKRTGYLVAAFAIAALFLFTDGGHHAVIGFFCGMTFGGGYFLSRVGG